ncbi:MAG: SUMF1/EgtB/PvdO family nonheme iron enzyme [Candidatus Hodarchaeota archaeon]
MENSNWNTRINIILRDIYGEEIFKVNLEKYIKSIVDELISEPKDEDIKDYISKFLSRIEIVGFQKQYDAVSKIGSEIGMAILLITQGKFGEAEKILNESLKHAKQEYAFPHIGDIYHNWAKLEEQRALKEKDPQERFKHIYNSLGRAINSLNIRWFTRKFPNGEDRLAYSFDFLGGFFCSYFGRLKESRTLLLIGLVIRCKLEEILETAQSLFALAILENYTALLYDQNNDLHFEHINRCIKLLELSKVLFINVNSRQAKDIDECFSRLKETGYNRQLISEKDFIDKSLDRSYPIEKSKTEKTLKFDLNFNLDSKLKNMAKMAANLIKMSEISETHNFEDLQRMHSLSQTANKAFADFANLDSSYSSSFDFTNIQQPEISSDYYRRLAEQTNQYCDNLQKFIKEYKIQLRAIEDNGTCRLEEKVKIPAGTFIIGSSQEEIDSILLDFPDVRPDYISDEFPTRQMKAKSFYIDKYPVTNLRYQEFINANGYKSKKYWSKEGWQFIQTNGYDRPAFWELPNYSDPNQPVVGVSWYEAEAFARWVGGRLPTEAEWEWAAHGNTRMRYTWGNKFDPQNCCFIQGTLLSSVLARVGSFPKGASLFGIMDLCGTVWEWCEDWYRPNSVYELPQWKHRLNLSPNNKVLKGGSFIRDPLCLRISHRNCMHPSARSNEFGFRCVWDI